MNIKGNEQFIRDMETVCNAEFIPWERLEGMTILITGRDGIDRHALVNSLLYANKKRRLNLKVKVLVRGTWVRDGAFQGGLLR